MLYKVVLTFKSVNETLVCNYSNESYIAVLSCGNEYFILNVVPKFPFSDYCIVSLLLLFLLWLLSF